MTAADAHLPSPTGAGHRPSRWILTALDGVKPDGHVLDVACGAGRHARAALTRGLRVTGIDIDAAGTADLIGQAGFTFIAADLETGAAFPLAGQRFDAVVVSNYLHRPLMSALTAAVASDGVLVYETFANGQERRGRPANPAFLLRPNELAEAAIAGGLVIVACEQGVVGDAATGPIVQRIIAVGRAHPWASGAPRLIEAAQGEGGRADAPPLVARSNRPT
ncbi:MAG: class I SAM-dependent methyltransferase [Ancalomicrobiaceae bacterium]|nr:class I SAM-dependent methyltransferase [Ancalomicrobiaceae bacterium]